MKHLYLILSIIWLIVPYYFLFSFIWNNWFDIIEVIKHSFQTNISSLWASDVIISAVVLIIFILKDGKPLWNKKYFPIIGTLTVWVSFGLPLYLYLKECKK